MERTCLLVKPDGVEKKVIGKVIDRLERENFRLLAIKMVTPKKSLIENFYSVHRGKPFFGGLVEFMCSGPFLAMVWEGEEIIARSRKIIGATNSQEAETGTLRNLYGTDNCQNLMHGSDSAESAEREIQLLFKTEEIVKNGRTNE